MFPMSFPTSFVSEKLKVKTDALWKEWGLIPKEVGGHPSLRVCEAVSVYLCASGPSGQDALTDGPVEYRKNEPTNEEWANPAYS